MKKVFSIFLVCLLCSFVLIPAEASMKTNAVDSYLSFSGNTAYCTASITNIGKDIDATMELWYGTTLMGVWFGSGTDYVSISGSASVLPGRTYTLRVYGTANGISFEAAPVSGSC